MIDRRDVTDVLTAVGRLPDDLKAVIDTLYLDPGCNETPTDKTAARALDAVIAGVHVARNPGNARNVVTRLYVVPVGGEHGRVVDALDVGRSGVVGQLVPTVVVAPASAELSLANIVLAGDGLPDPPVILAFPAGPRLLAYERDGETLICRCVGAGVVHPGERAMWSAAE